MERSVYGCAGVAREPGKCRMRSGFGDALSVHSADRETRESRLICCAPSRDRSMPPAAQMGLTVKLAKAEHSLDPAPGTRPGVSAPGLVPSAWSQGAVSYTHLR